MFRPNQVLPFLSCLGISWFGLAGDFQIPKIHGWAYQLQDIVIDEVAANNTFNLFVMDYSEDGTHDGRFSRPDIESIRASGKTVLAYISIGEAESYRFYWQSGWDKNGDGIPDAGAPAWLGPENPDWEGNYKVRFWYPGWQRIVLAMVDTLEAQGFDGIYCDIIDAYEYWSDDTAEEPKADSLMVQFLLRIRSHADSLRQPLFIVPQNGESLAWQPHVDESSREAFFSAIQAIGVEDVFFPGPRDEDNFFRPDAERIDKLMVFKNMGKPVLSVEYITLKLHKRVFVDTCQSLGFYPYATIRDLDRLNDGIDTAVPPTERENAFPVLRIHPNPFNSALTIRVSLPGPASYRLEIFDVLGRSVRLWTGMAQSGDGILWDCRDQVGREVAAGNYFVQLRSGTHTVIQKAVYIR